MKIYVLLDDYAGYESRFIGKHGVSYYIPGGKVNLLFDTGQDHESILYNMNLLGIDPKDITHIFLSHCHYDHTGGLLGILKEIGRRILVIAHRDLFRRNFIMTPYFREVGIPFTRSEIEQYAYLYLTTKPIRLSSDIITTGEVENRLDFERFSILTYTIKDGVVVEDPMEDDMSLCIETPKGLVVISGCSHAGIVSIVKRCIEVSSQDKVRAVIGGFHLIKASRERIKKTIEGFKKLKIEEVHTGHCTGLRAEAMFLEEYEDNFHKLQSGMVIEF